jgi:Winged helix-turn-helix domain (DUF2582)
MVHEIGDTAGKLWQYLAENPASTLDDAAKSLKLKDTLVHLAAGWLAREDKLAFEDNGKTFKVSVKSDQ